jgi:hypothetical protein
MDKKQKKEKKRKTETKGRRKKYENTFCKKFRFVQSNIRKEIKQCICHTVAIIRYHLVCSLPIDKF